MKPTIVILAAGMASRYGSMKQTEGFGPSKETIMEYSIYSAIKAGFGKVIFIIRKDFATDFKAAFIPKLKDKIEVVFVYQELHYFVHDSMLPPKRTKPWGTGHAMLCAREAVKEPFCIINADDFYGQDAFDKAAEFLMNRCTQKQNAIIGYTLSNTLSEHGFVSRGVCEVNDKNELTKIKEHLKIYKKGDKIISEEWKKITNLRPDTYVSMNFWCFHASIFNLTEILFREFPRANYDDIKAEFFIPIIASHFISEFGGVITVIPTTAQWFGVTYKEDAPIVKHNLEQLIADGQYPPSLWA